LRDESDGACHAPPSASLTPHVTEAAFPSCLTASGGARRLSRVLVWTFNATVRGCGEPCRAGSSRGLGLLRRSGRPHSLHLYIEPYQTPGFRSQAVTTPPGAVRLYESVLTSIALHADVLPGEWKSEPPTPAFLARVGSRNHEDHVILPEIWPTRGAAYKTGKLISACRQLEEVKTLEGALAQNGSTAWSLKPESQPEMRKKRDVKRGLCNSTSTWIVRGRACITLTREELAALAIITGMIFTEQESSLYPMSFGGFGFSLDISHADAAWSVALVQGSRLPRHAPSMGHGCTTLMAKYLACDSIPFAQNDYWVRSVYITEDVLKAVRKGRNVIDSRASGGDSLDFLRRLPGDRLIDALYGVHDGRSHSTGAGKAPQAFASSAGLGGDSPSHGRTEVGSWARAVVGIAFGGPVPQASRNVREAVAFTVGGSEDHMGSCIEAIESLVDLLHGWDEVDNLFGDNVMDHYVAEGNSDVNYTFPSAKSSPTDAAAVFSRYANLLERVLALVVGLPKPESQQPAVQAPTTPQPLTPRAIPEVVEVNDVVNAAAQQIEEVYKAAVAANHGPVLLPGTVATRADADLGSLLSELINAMKSRRKAATEPVLSLSDCATIVRCLLAVWAFTVPLIEVKQAVDRGANGRTAATTGGKQVSSRIVLGRLPPVSAFC